MKLDQVTRRFRLAKSWLCLLVGLSTLFGFLLAAGRFSLSGGVQGGGIFLLAMGGATLNSWQERESDSRMQRTRKRPMVVGEFSNRQALVQAFLLIGGGWLLLVGAASVFTAMFALTGLVLYNMLYTPLKRKSLFAIFPGAVCGALPPCVGWLGGGGSLGDYHFWLLFGLFFLWQMPHFWLVMMMHQKDYIQGPYPSLLDHFPGMAVKRFFIPWIGSLLTAMILFGLLPELGLTEARWLIILNCLLLGGAFILQLGTKKQPGYRLLFIAMNWALVAHMSVVSLAILVP